MKRRILLADDSVTIQKVIELTFMDEDYEVRAVSNGDEAIAALSERPDFVIADVHMPGASGYEVCRRAKQERPDLPVLLLVGTFEPFDEVQARECGADSFLKKPFDSQDLLVRVEELMSAHGGAAFAAAPATSPAPATSVEAAWPELEVQAEPEPEPVSAPEPAPGRAPAWYDSPFPPLDEEQPAPRPAAFQPEEESPFQLEDDRSYASPPALAALAADTALPEGEPMFDLDEDTAGSEEATAAMEAPAPSPAGFAWSDAAASNPLSLLAPAPSDTERLGVPEEAAPEEPAYTPAAVPPPIATPAPAPAADTNGGGRLSEQDVDRIARRVVELLGDRTVRDIAWEVIPDMAEVVIRDRLRELESQAENLA